MVILDDLFKVFETVNFCISLEFCSRILILKVHLTFVENETSKLYWESCVIKEYKRSSYLNTKIFFSKEMKIAWILFWLYVSVCLYLSICLVKCWMDRERFLSISFLCNARLFFFICNWDEQRMYLSRLILCWWTCV